MVVELWARNPHSYIRECALTDQLWTAWDKGALSKRGIGLTNFMRLHVPNRDYRALIISDQGAVEIDRHHTVNKPVAVYPVWEYGQYKLEHLEWLMAENRSEGLLQEAITRGKEKSLRAVPGQEHRVVVTHIPSLRDGVGQKFMSMLVEMQADYPHCILHVHGFTSLGWVGSGVRAGDIDLRVVPSKGNIWLGNGRQIHWKEAMNHRAWVRMTGYKQRDLADPSHRCQASILSAQWAAANWHKADFPKRRTMTEYDFRSIINGDMVYESEEVTSSGKRRGVKPMVGDKFYCEACSFQNECRAFRVGSVCTLPGSEAMELSRLFKSRDSGQIIEGLGKLIEQDVERLEVGRELEIRTNTLDEHVTKIAEKTFRKAVDLAKLLDPSLRTSALVQVNGRDGSVNVNNEANSRTLQERVSASVLCLESAGVPRSNITQDMIQRIMEADHDNERVKKLAEEEATKFVLPVGLIDAELSKDG